VPFEALLNARCRPLLNQFLVQDHYASPVSEPSSGDDAEYFNWTARSGNYELYIPAPPMGDRRKVMLHHIATRNFFAWMFGRPIVGPHLGGALVALLNSMDEFRLHDANNVGDILDYMEEEDYADMRSDPNHALAILFFAEHFQFKTLWIDAYSHCAGMSERLFESSEYEVGLTYYVADLKLNHSIAYQPGITYFNTSWSTGNGRTLRQVRQEFRHILRR
jgi:hypothetical protein